MPINPLRLGRKEKIKQDNVKKTIRDESHACQGVPATREGWLTKEGRVVKSWKRRYFVLQAGRLFYYADTDLTAIKGFMHLMRVSAEPGEAKATIKPTDPLSNNDYRFRFGCIGKDRRLYLSASTEEDRDGWIRAIEDAVRVQNYLKDCQKLEVKPYPFFVECLKDRNSDMAGVVASSVWAMQHKRKAGATQTTSAFPQAAGSVALTESLGKPPLLLLNEVTSVCLQLYHNRFISRLTLANTGLGDATIGQIADVLATNRWIKELDLSHNRISDTGAAVLCEGLYLNLALESLDLTSNDISDTGAVHVAELLRANQSLKRLVLSRNVIGSEGAKQFAAAIADSTGLQEFDISHNHIGDTGAIAISEGLKDSESLLSIDLSFNHIGFKGANALADALFQVQALESIGLGGNYFDEDCSQILVSALMECRTLRRIGIGDNMFLNQDSVGVLDEVFRNGYVMSKLTISRGQVDT